MALWQLRRHFEFEGELVRHDAWGEGPPLVLVHGTPWSSFNWRHLLPALAQRHRVFAFDLLGYGQSQQGPAGQDVSLGRQARLLAALLQHWKLEAPDVLGHDFGGTTVLRAHLLLHCAFRRIVLADPVALAPWGSPFFAHVRQHEAAFAGVPDDIHEAIVSAYVKGAMHQPMPGDTLDGILQPWRGEAGRAAFYRQIAQADPRYTDEIEAAYARITVPTLIVWGAEDGWIPAATGRRLQAAIRGAAFLQIEGAGHLVQEDRPAALAEAVLDFLA